MRQKMLLLAAVFFGLLAFVLTYHQIQAEKKRVLGAARDVVLIRFRVDKTEGEKIQDADIMAFKTKRFNSNLLREVNWKMRKQLVGRQLSVSVKKGDLLSWNDIQDTQLRAQEGLAGIIPQNMRAISIAVDATSSVTGLVRPDNRVDIIGTFRFPEMKGDKQFDTLTLTILQNVEVLATGSDYGKSYYSMNQAKRKGYSTVSLALTPKEVEMIVFASSKGRLVLSLRNNEETKVEIDGLQSVNFKYLEDNIKNYTKERMKFIRNRGRKGMIK